jgi:hypothetical protein
MAVKAKLEAEYTDPKGAEALSSRSRYCWLRDTYEGKISSVKIGRKVLIPIREIRRRLEEATRPRTDQAVISNEDPAGPGASAE